MKNLKKYQRRFIKKNFLRLLFMSLIIMVGISFVTGVGGITPKIKNSYNHYFKESNISDLTLKSSHGFDPSLTDYLNSLDEVVEFENRIQLDQKIDDKNIRINIIDEYMKLDKIELIKGTMPENSNEILIDNVTSSNYDIDSIIKIYNQDFKVVGVINTPTTYTKDGDINLINQETLDINLFMTSNILYLPYTDLSIKIKTNENYFSKEYKNQVTSFINEISENINDYEIVKMTDLKSYQILSSILDKIDIIALLFPLFFTLVVSLVVLTTITRIISETRQEIGCLKSLGYKDSEIIRSYLLFSSIALFFGIALGLIIGAFFLPNIIYPAFAGVFITPKRAKTTSIKTGLYSSLLMILASYIVTIYEAKKELNEKPKDLLLPKSPKPGKKILLERTKLWNKIKFKYKSCLRNIFRYKARFYMIVLSLLGSSALVTAGLSLYDYSRGEIHVQGMNLNMSDTLAPISLAIILFALALAVLVLFNLTNMSIEERKREIATLKVLGYLNKEVITYIYREILIMSLIGILLGIPSGILLVSFIFKTLEMGSLKDVHIYVYPIVFLISLIFILIVDLMLVKKIKKVNMNDSLKSLE